MERYAQRPVDPEAEVVAAITELRRGHEVGQAVRSRIGDHANRGEIAKVAAEFGYTIDATRKLRQFAACYTKRDVDELCRLCREHNRAFGLSSMYRLVSIKDKAKRSAFQKLAIENHWGHARIAREIARRFKLGHKRGRKAHLPESVREALADIEEARERLVQLLEHCVSLADRTEAGSRQERQRLGRISNRLLAALVGDEARFRRATAASRRS